MHRELMQNWGSSLNKYGRLTGTVEKYRRRTRDKLRLQLLPFVFPTLSIE